MISRVEMYDLKPDIEEVSPVDAEEEDAWEPQFRPEIPRLPFEERKFSLKKQSCVSGKSRPGREAGRCLRCDLERRRGL